MERIRLHFIEQCVYSRRSENFKVAAGEVPPIIAPSLRGPSIFNSEMEKKSAFLKDNKNPEGNYSFYMLPAPVWSK